MQSPLITTVSEEEFVDTAASLIANQIRKAIAARGRCSLALSGGSTPGPVYERLAALADIDWSAVIILLVDERCVPVDDEQSNQKMIIDRLLRHLPTRPARFIGPNTKLNPDDAAMDYAHQIEEVLDVEPLDVCVLGLGDDGHTASLFPPLPPAAKSPLTAIHTEQDRFPVIDRLSLTLPVLGAARAAIILLTGEKKKAVYNEMLASPVGADRWPLKAVLEGGHATTVAWW